MTTRTFALAALFLLASTASLFAQDDLPDELKKLGAKVAAQNVFKPTFSPDGKKLAIGRMPVGSGITVVDLSDMKVTEIGKEGKDPAWCPTRAELLVYVTKNNADEEIWTMTPTGENPRKVADAGFPTWSGDGKTLYCQSRKLKKILAFDMTADEPKLKEEIEVPFAFYPAISPDEKLAAYHFEGKLNIYDLKAKRLVRTWPVPGWGGLLPGWSPDSKFVAFGTYGHGDGMGFWLLDVPAARVTEIGKGSYTMGAWSPDGKQFAFDLREIKKYQVLIIDAAKLPGVK